MRTRRPLYFLVIAVLPFLFMLQEARIREPLHAMSLTVMEPFLTAGAQLENFISHSRDNIVQFWRTFRKQDALELRVAELEAKQVRFEETFRENERLKELLNFKKSLPAHSIACRVIAYDVSPWRKSVVLDKGKTEGIRKDMPVLSPKGLVGRVIEVGLSTSRVLLLTDFASGVSAMTAESRAQGVVVGDGSPVLKMKYLMVDSGVAVEEMVLTSGAGGLFPKGLRMGRLTSILRDPDGLHLIAHVEPFVDFSKLEEVLCLVSSPPKS